MNKQQLNRLILLCSELRNNKYPNATSFTRKLKRLSEEDSRYLSVSTKTFDRDIKLLKKEFHAPVYYYPKERGYRLEDHTWEFQTPLLDEPDLIDLALVGKIANDLLPAPLKNNFMSYNNQMLASQSTEFFEHALMDSFIINWGVQRQVNNKYFQEIFLAWQKRQCISMSYQKSEEGQIQDYIIEPHVITFNNNTWYIVGKKLPSAERRTFALQRIKGVEILDKVFENDLKLVRGVHEKGPYYEPDLKDVKLIYTGGMKDYARETYPEESIDELEDSTLLVVVPFMRSFDLENHILMARGQVKDLDKPEINKRIKAICEQEILQSLTL